MTAPNHIASARAAFDRHAWTEAYDAFGLADRETSLGSRTWKLRDARRTSSGTMRMPSRSGAAPIRPRSVMET